tara:strand:+ start:26 stop:451 length:426 start_codon:yes stop_codon:yes gene_type:complete
MTRAQKQAQRDSIDHLRELLHPGDTVYTILDHCSRSGMTRHIRVVIARTGDDGRTYHLHPNWHVATALGVRQAKRGDGVVMGGCGMDMGFQLVYTLSATLWPDGFVCLGDRCRSNDHSNGDRDRTPHHHKSGGYALTHEWL